MSQSEGEGSPLGRTEPQRVEGLANRQVTNHLVEPQCQRTRTGGEVQQVGGGERQARVAEQLLDEVGLQALLEEREARAGTDIRPERHAHPVLDVVTQREEATAQGGVARGAVRDGGALTTEQTQLARRRVHVVGEDR